MSEKTISCIIGGLGHIGKRHRTIVEALPGFKLAGIADPNASLFGDTTGIETFARIEDIPEQKADLISICTPNGMHAAQGIYALEKGYHVIIEKPMSLGATEAERLIETAEKVNKHLFVVKQNRFSPVIQWLQELLKTNQLGRIYHVAVQCNWNRGADYFEPNGWHGTSQLDGGPLYTQFSHFVDILWWLFGPLETDRPQFFNFNHPYLPFEDSGRFGFFTQSGTEGMFQYSLSAFGKNMESSLTLLGEKGSVKIGGAYMDEIEYCLIDGMNEKPHVNLISNQLPQQAQLHGQFYEYVYKIINKQLQPAGETNQAAAVVTLIEQLYKLR